MKRIQIQLDPQKYELVKRKAYSENKSMAAVIRDAVDAYLEVPEKPKRRLTLDDFTCIGKGRLDPNYYGPLPLSVYHDEVWEEDWRD